MELPKITAALIMSKNEPVHFPCVDGVHAKIYADGAYVGLVTLRPNAKGEVDAWQSREGEWASATMVDFMVRLVKQGPVEQLFERVQQVGYAVIHAVRVQMNKYTSEMLFDMMRVMIEASAKAAREKHAATAKPRMPLVDICEVEMKLGAVQVRCNSVGRRLSSDAPCVCASHTRTFNLTRPNVFNANGDHL